MNPVGSRFASNHDPSDDTCSNISINGLALNGVEPFAYLRDVLQRMVDGHPMNCLDEFLPWNWKPDPAKQ